MKKTISILDQEICFEKLSNGNWECVTPNNSEEIKNDDVNNVLDDIADTLDEDDICWDIYQEDKDNKIINEWLEKYYER